MPAENNPRLPRTDRNLAVQLVPPFAALEETADTTISASTEITLQTDPKTTLIEVSAIAQAIFMKWGTSDATSTDFDHLIHAGSTRHFVVPDGITAVNFIEHTAGAELYVSEFGNVAP